MEPPSGIERPARADQPGESRRSYIDGKVWLQDAGTYTVLRLDLGSGKFEVFEPVHDSEAERL